ncbi:MAG: radical SAM protein [Deltaproteobacteria bacterium]|jgi:radical SAM superfamily enzyme YgiQ (UPF0313 family)|nr:radical SAM protein [Deltaproteobacteria bacterium]
MPSRGPKGGRFHEPSVEELLAAERGAIFKEPGGRIRIGLVWPGSYYTGMSSLGFLSIYALMNANPRVVAERFFQPPPGQMALSLESRTRLEGFDLIAISLSLENDYWICLNILSKGRVNPERSQRRGEPLVIAGGVGIWANPWPLIPFIDLILLGEGEAQWPLILKLYVDPLFMVATKAEKLRLLSENVPGTLIPSHWPEVVLIGEAPLKKPVRPAILTWSPRGYLPPTSPIITPYTEFSDVRLVEISRGCPYGCRFCLVNIYRPHRAWPKNKIFKALGKPKKMGEAVGLVSPAIADHPEIESILDMLKDQGRIVSVSSLRLTSLTENLTRKLLSVGVKGLAVAPEAGSQRLRDVINKAITEEEILSSCRLLSESGLRKLKLYFMIGLPTETNEDLQAIVDLCEKIQKSVRAKTYAPKLVVSVAIFCPKPHTPFETAPLLVESKLLEKAEFLQKGLRKIGGVELKIDPPIWSLVQGLLARGGAESADLVRALWSENGRTKAAYRKYKALLAERDKYGRNYFLDSWPKEKYMPWRVVSVAAGPDFLAAENQLAKEGVVSPPCPPENFCGRCGACRK